MYINFRFLAPAGRTLVLRESGTLMFRAWGVFTLGIVVVTKIIG